MRGRLFYLMGPSGAGKDTLLRRCRQRLCGQPCLVAARYITRAPELHGENHLALSEAEFEQRVQLDVFALYWNANGHRYGIGVEIDQWLARGIDVLVNGSRAHLEEARARYGEQLVPMLLQVDPQVLEHRLRARGREGAEQIAARVARARQLSEEVVMAGALPIDNSGDLDTALEQLLAAVSREPRWKERVGER